MVGERSEGQPDFIISFLLLCLLGELSSAYAPDAQLHWPLLLRHTKPAPAKNGPGFLNTLPIETNKLELMCLYVGNKNGFVTKEEITVYKALSKSGRGYKTPSQGYPAKIGQDLVPSNPEPSISKCGFKFSLDGGAIHTFLNPVKALENYSGCEIFKATIPAGTHIWIQDDLGQIAASRVYISKDTITKADKALYQSSLKPLHDQFLKTAEVRLADGRDVILSPVQARKGDKVIGIKIAGHIVSTQYFEALEFCHNSRTISTPKPMSWDEASKTLTIGARKGNYDGMLQNRKFRIVAVSPDKGVGDGESILYDAEVSYDGTAIRVPLQASNVPAPGEEDFPDAIKSISAVPVLRNNAHCYYTLSGHEIQHPSAGLYVHNGQVVFQK